MKGIRQNDNSVKHPRMGAKMRALPNLTRPVLSGVCVAAFLLLLGTAIYINNPFNLWIGRTYISQLIEMVKSDDARESTRLEQSAEIEHQLHAYQMRYRQTECEGKDNTRYTWLTALVNDDFIVPNVVMGYMLDKLSCYRSKIAIVGEGVTEEGRKALQDVGFKIRSFPGMNCDTMDEWWGRAPQHTTFIGMHTRLWAFNMTEYDKIVYLDGDYFPLVSLDKMFDIAEPGKLAATYCSKPGVVDPCFNSGMIVFQPNELMFKELMDLWRALSYYECVDDQRLMWYYFSNSNRWQQIPYSFNVRRERHYPMKSYHFAGGGRLPKPWQWSDKPTRQEAAALDTPLVTIEDIYRIWWKYLYQGLEEYGLWGWWHDTQVYKKFRHSDPKTDFRAVDIY